MSKAEEKALEAYPVDIIGYTIKLEVGEEPKPMDRNGDSRKIYTEGYKQAEKDLALTWKDIDTLNRIDRELIMENPNLQFEKKNKYFKILAERFNEQRNK